MKLHSFKVNRILIGFILLATQSSRAWSQDAASRDSITHGKYTLIFISNEPTFNPVTRQKLIDAFFNVYPKEADRFNHKTLRKVTIFIDTAYDAVAATGDGVARINPIWLKEHPEDIDVVTHEVMHIVQDYEHDGPGWLTEGIADYARYVYGVNNIASGWTLTDYNTRQSYTNAYRITARFLVWVEKNKNPQVVDKLDYAMRAGTYTPSLWVTLTGKSVDDLWAEYAQAPTVSLTYK